ncbi:efflux transporter outer membrane subunit [Gluconacetobacter entanii]|nr:efflux transporter outer membrane subunit [Gluconacetobacter entanii]
MTIYGTRHTTHSMRLHQFMTEVPQVIQNRTLKEGTRCLIYPGARRRPAAAIIRQSVFAAVMSCLTACAVGPNYRTPQISLIPFHNVSKTAFSISSSENAVSWWKSFHDTELDKIESRVLTQNLDLKAAYARVLQGRAIARSAAAQMLPTLDFSPQVSATRLSEEGLIGHIVREIPHFNRDYREYNVGGVASWELDIAGGLRRAHEAARDEFQAAEAEGDGTRLSLAAEAADTYLRIRGDQARLRIARDVFTSNQKMMDLIRQRRSRNVADDRELSSATVVVEAARQNMIDIEKDEETQSNRLDVLMGTQPGTYAVELRIYAELPAVPAPSANAQPLEVLRRRPDVIASERRLAASNARIGEALANYYPKISLQGALGFESMSPQQLFTAPGFQPTATGALRWRIFDFGKISSDVSRARGSYAEALASYQATMLRAAEDVEDAFFHLSQTRQAIASQMHNVEALHHAAALTWQSYTAGTLALNDALQANITLLNAQDRLASMRAEEDRAAVECFRALGGGWQS